MTDAERLRVLLAEAELSQRGAARLLDIDERSMRRYCAGTSEVPRAVWLALEFVRRYPRIADAYIDSLAA